MIMSEILIYILFAYGLSNLLVFGMGPYDLLEQIRVVFKKVFGKLGNMLDCMMCTSANIGWIVSLLNIFFLSIPLTPMNILYWGLLPWYIIVFGDLCITSGSVWLINTLQEYLERGNQNGQGD
jgi:hypothetical protein